MARFVCVHLSGGLGNQMFQYAAGRSLAKRNRADLVLDTWSGFVRDRQYRRHYELGPLSIAAREATPFERLPFWFERLQHRLSASPSSPIINAWYGHSIAETKREFLPEVSEHSMTRSCWMTGYWQTARYFQDDDALIRKELSPARPNDARFVALGRQMQDTNSVAIGIRLYEESAYPSKHAAQGRIKTCADINVAVDALASGEPDLHYFVFCTHRARELTGLRLSDQVTYVTHDDGFIGSLERLWLLTQCRHHIMTNSTYYWWGAWLGAGTHPAGPPQVYAADNFINADSVAPDWQQF